MWTRNIRNFLISVPTTKFRILVSIILSAILVISHVGWGVQPAESVLVFVLAMAGIDVTQYFVKRSHPVDVPEEELEEEPAPPDPTIPNTSDKG